MMFISQRTEKDFDKHRPSKPDHGCETDEDLQCHLNDNLGQDIYCGTETPTKREEKAAEQFKQGGNHLDRTEDALRDAIHSIDKGDKEGAWKDLKRSEKELGKGVDDYKDGLKIHPNEKGDESGVKDGLKTAKSVDASIDAAQELLKRGCPEEAKLMMKEALKNLDQTQGQLKEGLDKMNGCDKPKEPKCDDKPKEPTVRR